MNLTSGGHETNLPHGRREKPPGIAKRVATLVFTKWRNAIKVFLIVFGAATVALWIYPTFFSAFSGIPNTIAWTVTALVAVLVLPRTLKILLAKRTWSYSPLAGVPVGIAAVVILVSTTSLVPNLDPEPALTDVPIILLLAFLAVMLINALFRRSRTSPALNPSSAEPIETYKPLTAIFDLETILKWLKDDAAITNSSQDLFGHHIVAKRIAERLLEGTPSQAVLGGLGSGKTSLASLVQSELDTRPHPLQFVRVELWPYETTHAAVKGILSALIDKLSEHTDTFALRGVPAKYIQIISAKNQVAGALVDLFQPPSDLTSILSSIDELCKKISITVVLWVDDLERFAVGNPQVKNPETHEEAEKLAPVRALLYGLDQQQSIAVITATTTLYRRFDLEKTARFIEELPSVTRQEAKRVMSLVRASWYSQDEIDPTPADRRNDLGWDAQEDLPWVTAVAPGPHTLADACADLCRTPRGLKQVLRRANETCLALRGEIDYDAVIAMECIRAFSPDAFAAIQNHRMEILSREYRNGGISAPEPIAQLRAELSDVGIDDSDSEAIMKIVDSVFGQPGFAQGFSHIDSPYWQRFLTVQTLQDDDKDQPVLRAIRDNDSEAIFACLLDHRSTIVERFGESIPTQLLIELLLPIAMHSSADSPDKWEDPLHPPGVHALWRMLRTRDDVEPRCLSEQIESVYRILMPLNPSIVAIVENYYTYSDEHSDFLSTMPDRQQELETLLRNLLQEVFGKNPGLLADKLVNADRRILIWLCWGEKTVRLQGTLDQQPFDGWLSFAATTIEAAKINPIALLPQLATLLTEEADPLQRRWAFLEKRCINLFGEKAAVLDLFRHIPSELNNNPMVLGIRDAADEAH
ncbi:MAG: hypothetical protein IPL79_12505 [Myxococcales bacterium]|nr:hypothetical protein [Myxococcales bacterium]